MKPFPRKLPEWWHLIVTLGVIALHLSGYAGT
jgi:hypothetical protein